MDWARKITFDHNGHQHRIYKIKVNNCKLTDFVIRIELTRAILMQRFSNFQRNSTIHFCMFLYLVTYFRGVTVSLLCRLQAVSKIHVPIYPYLISEGRWNCSTLWPHSNETATLRKHVPEYETGSVDTQVQIVECNYWVQSTQQC